MRQAWTTDDIRNALDGKPSRRGLLCGAAAGLAGAFLAPFFPRNALAEEGGELKLLAWEGYAFEKELGDFFDKEGIKLQMSSISTQDDVQAKLVGNTPTVIDVTSYNQGYADYYGKELKIMSPLDRAKLPNYNPTDIFEQFYEKPLWYWDGELYGVVMGWGLNLLVYNPKLVPKPASYKDLLKPEYSGKLTFMDDTLATWPMIARVAGFGKKFPNLTPEELSQAFEALLPYREQCRVFVSSGGDAVNLFANGEIGIVFSGWSSFPVDTAAQGVETVTTIPEEGASMWSDAFFIPKTATNRAAAHKYINAILSAEAQAAHAALTRSGTINKKALPLMDAPTRALFDYDNLDALFKATPLNDMPPRTSDKYATFDQWTKAWEDFKSGF